MFSSNSPSVKKGDHCIFLLSKKPFRVCIGEFQVFLDGLTGNPKTVCCNSAALTLIMFFYEMLVIFFFNSKEKKF
jgi:hypothetical protein